MRLLIPSKSGAIGIRVGRGGQMAVDPMGAMRATGLFKGMSDEDLERILQLGRIEYWAAGATVLEEGEHGPRMMVLLDGEAEVFRNDPSGVPRLLATVRSGEVLGEMSLLLRAPRTATVRALSAIQAFAMDQHRFEDLVDQGDVAVLRLGLQLGRGLARRLHLLNAQVVDQAMRLEHGEGEVANARQEILKLWDY